LLPHFDRQFLRQVDDFIRQGIDHDLTLVHLKIAERFMEAAEQLLSRAGVAAIEAQPQRNGIAIDQALAPPAWDDERGPDAPAQKIAFVSLAGRLFAPGEGVVRAKQLDETFRGRCGILIYQNSRHILALARLKSVPEDEGEDRRQSEEQNQDAPVPINMEELLVGHAPDGCE
jgi:hypothetical protein